MVANIFSQIYLVLAKLPAVAREENATIAGAYELLALPSQVLVEQWLRQCQFNAPNTIYDSRFPEAFVSYEGTYVDV